MIPMTKEALAELREVADKATPGPWLWINTGSYFSFLVPQSNQDPHNCIVDDGSSWGEYAEKINPESPDGVFISAANPATVLALLNDMEAKDKRIAELEESHRQVIEARDFYKRLHEEGLKAISVRAESAEQALMAARSYVKDQAASDGHAFGLLQAIDRIRAGITLQIQGGE